nr:hypothetical protein GCM10020185_76530 [Pseudomonas brassicacearum subsp. brassicacearum]
MSSSNRNNTNPAAQGIATSASFICGGNQAEQLAAQPHDGGEGDCNQDPGADDFNQYITPAAR